MTREEKLKAIYKETYAKIKSGELFLVMQGGEAMEDELTEQSYNAVNQLAHEFKVKYDVPFLVVESAIMQVANKRIDVNSI